MKKKFNKVYQFKIALDDTEPPIWRRIQVPETYSFWDLHVAIQDAMGWFDSHLHEFEIIDPSLGEEVRIGIRDKELGWEGDILQEQKQKIADYFSMENRRACYTYDFGDSWDHTVTLEKILPREEGTDYPRCIDGRRACPPEDCGGVWGYEELLRIIRNPKHKEHKQMLEWVGGEFDPEDFDADEVSFDDPDERRKSL